MSDGYTEFTVFVQVGLALGALCLAPVIFSRLVNAYRARDWRMATGVPVPATGVIADAIAPQPIDDYSRVHDLEYDVIESRASSRRAAAVRSLRRLNSEDAMTTMLVAVLDGNERVRAEAAKGLAELGDPAAVEPLVHAVATRSRRADSARAAILGLGPVALGELRRIERDEHDPQMRRTAEVLEHAIA